MTSDTNCSPPAGDDRKRKKRQILLTMVIGLLVAGLPLFELAEHLEGKALLSRDGIREIGAAFGMLAVMLFSLQFIIGARLRLLDRIFPLNRQFVFHRIFGLTTALCALIHPLAMFGPDLFGVKFNDLLFWPGLIGAAVLAGLWGAGTAALFRQPLKIPFHLWHPMHRFGTLGLALLVLIHFSFAEGRFEIGMVHAVLIAALLIYGLSFWLNRGVLYQVVASQAVGRGTRAFDLEPLTAAKLSYLPGQFVLVTFHTKTLPREEHPWTVSGSPSEDPGLQLTIKKSGDFTARLDAVTIGDRVRVRGPYGNFGPFFCEKQSGTGLVMIAAGVGITPFLSMLRSFARDKDRRKLILIWSNRTAADILWKDEFQRLREKLPHFIIHHVLTREPSKTGHAGHMTSDMLKTFLSGTGPQDPVFICGPGPMMTDLQAQLNRLGIDPSRVYCERFQI